MQKNHKIFDVCSGKNLPCQQSHIQNDIENTRTPGAKYIQSYHKDTRTFFLLLMYLFAQ